MCGFIGYWNIDSKHIDIEHLLKYVSHRGPDDKASICKENWGLGHHRLSIIDPDSGRQPMKSKDSSVILSSNNEIYNFREIRAELEKTGHKFTTKSDTEVILHAYQQWGTDCFKRFIGMFAIAIIDLKNNVCILARDHLGVKPLHYVSYKSGVFFSSNIKPILALGDFSRKLRKDSFHLFMNFRYIPDNRTLFENVHRVEPGSILKITPGNKFIKIKYYEIASKRRVKFNNIKEAEESLHAELSQAVERHLVSDVEVGLYLSGGMDSSTISYLAAKKNKNIKSFCINFGEPSDEGKDAQLMADYIGSEHKNLFVGENPLKFLPEVIWHVEEPKVNCLQGYLLAREVSKHVKVVLSGLGGDELFAGYINNDILYPVTMLSKLYKSNTSSHLYSLNSLLQSLFSSPGLDHYFRIFDLSLSAYDPLRFYCILRNCFDHNDFLLNSLYKKYDPNWKDLSYNVLKPMFEAENPDILSELLLLEMKTKLTNDFLLNEDRVSMAHGLEVRVPLLDQKLVDFTLALPTSWKYLPFNKKRILKNSVQKWLPPEILKKRKWGFSFNPYYQFRKDLKNIARKILTKQEVEKQGLFSWNWIDKVINTAPTPRMRWHYFNLWVMVGFTIWHKMFIENFSENPPEPIDL